MNAATVLPTRSIDEENLSMETAKEGEPIYRLLRIEEEVGPSTSLTKVQGTLEPSNLKDQFQKLSKTWHAECAHLSSIREMVLHHAYQRIIGMGPSALPFILNELENQPDHWFWALRAITGEDPVSSTHRGNITQMANDWIEWASTRGLIP